MLTILLKNGIIVFVARECWNWQTGKTKDLVGVCSCGFKSHLPHCYLEEESLLDYKGSFFVRPWALRALWDRAGILQNTGVIYNGIC